MSDIKNLAEFESVDLWLTELAHEKTGSACTRELYLPAFTRFCNSVRKNPDELVRIGKRDPAEVELMVAKHIVALENGGISRNSCVTYYAVIRSFFRHNGIVFMKRTPQRWAKNRSRPLPKEELRAIMEFASPRLKAFMAVMKDSGLAPVDILTLKCGDMNLNANPPIPLQLVRTKTKVEFLTFIGPDAITYLKRYLSLRETGTRRIPPEKISPESPLFRAMSGKVAPATRDMIESDFDSARALAGVKARLYDLRKFFNTQLRLAHVSDDIIEHWMGHKLPGSRGAYLVPTIQEQAAEYARAYPRISLFESESVAAVKDAWKEQLTATLRLNPMFSPQQVETIRKELDKFRDLSDVDWDAMRLIAERTK
jgi:integrase